MIDRDLLMIKFKNLRWSYVAGTRGNHRSHTSQEHAQINEIFADVLNIIKECERDGDDLK